MPRRARKPPPPAAVVVPIAPPPGPLPLTATDIEEQTDAGSFQRGRAYARSGRIFDGIRRGVSLRARCHGSSGGPYLVQATLAASATVDETPIGTTAAPRRHVTNPVTSRCDCPRGGFCKHVVALLLTWIESPSTFAERLPLSDLLANKSQAELIALVAAMLDAAPDLEDLIELPPPVVDQPSADPVDPGAVARQVTAALSASPWPSHRSRGWGYDDWGDGESAIGVDIEKLDRVAALADAYAAGGHWRNAFVVAATLSEKIAPDLDESVIDEEGILYALLARCDRVLANALAAQPGLPAADRLSTEERQRLIDALIDLWQADAAVGGQGFADEGPTAIASHATPAEQLRVGAHLRELIHPQTTPHDSQAWLNRITIGFLSRLTGDAGLSAEALLAAYRAAELWPDAADFLLAVDRTDEAIALAARHLGTARDLLRFADRLVAAAEPGRAVQAIDLVESRLWEQEGKDANADRLAQEWLERHYAAHGQPRKALETARRRFQTAPSRTTYDAVATAAHLPDQPDDPWPSLRPELLAIIEKRGDWVALIDIHLAAGDVGEALAELAKREGNSARGGASSGPRPSSGWGSPGWESAEGGPEARLAAAAETSQPKAAAAIYRTLAERQIAGRQRSAYREAAAFLARVKAILEATDRSAAWQIEISELRARHKTLRALREELDAVGLL